MAQVRVYATTYKRGDAADNMTHDLGWFPAAPVAGQTLHYGTTKNEDDTLPWLIDRVSWCLGTKHFGSPGHWHIEIAMSAR
ncbi:hypothetical protein Hosp_043 [Mycobacterium phage Hosp]|uniref:hypothetical protein n=1 Tax=Mycobacterium phage Hosp TaxID=1463811 RepID=UPI00042F6481|nr:hypothetical protein FH38_gp43 [Mycobacterium phage Hosp]AHK11997.1 hypothetical protein Hosp_043 [Mycobacterium phage Hosp]